MRPVRKAIVASAAVIALAAVAGWAAAEIKDAHVMEVRLPDGSVARFRYAGDSPPMVSIGPAPIAFPSLAPTLDPWSQEAPFAALARLSATMDREADAILREAPAHRGLAFQGSDLARGDLRKPPSGAQAFSTVSTLSGNSNCTRSVQYTWLGDGKPPQVVTHTAGACAADQKQSSRPGPSGSTAADAQTEHAARQPV
jgi:hypothetical protein